MTTIYDDLRALAPLYRKWSRQQQREWALAQSAEVQRALLYCWELVGRTEQLRPAVLHFIHLAMCGRGWGKTRALTERIRTWARLKPGCTVNVVCQTHEDFVKLLIRGPSGLLRVCPPEELNPDKINYSSLTVNMEDGTTVQGFSALVPDSLRGPECDYLAFDELAAMRYAEEAFENAERGLRSGQVPEIFIATTPRPIGLLKRFVKAAREQSTITLPDGRTVREVVLSTGTSFDNPAISVLQRLRWKLMAGRNVEQELYGRLLEDVPGALWTLDDMERCRVDRVPCDLRKIVVAIDPATTSNEDSDETGIVVAGLGVDEHGYVLADQSLRAKPEGWAATAVQAYYHWKADHITAESNQGGDMVRAVIHAYDPNASVHLVHASHGKITRAEPVSTQYKQGLVHHVGEFTQLEDQMTTYEMGTPDSPDRMDALVWAITDLTGIGGRDGVLGYWDKMIAAGKVLAEKAEKLGTPAASVPIEWPTHEIGMLTSRTKEPERHTVQPAAPPAPCPQCGAVGMGSYRDARVCHTCGYLERLVDRDTHPTTTMASYKRYD